MITKFTRWHKWDQRSTIKNIGAPGVYALAISEKDLSENVFEFAASIKYFGMTNSRSGLKGRLIQFDNTIKGKSGHGGADRFRYKHPDYVKLVDQLFVSIAPFACNVSSSLPEDLEVMGEVAKFEYLCFAQYVREFGHLPEFNDRKKALKYSLTMGRDRLNLK